MKSNITKILCMALFSFPVMAQYKAPKIKSKVEHSFKPQVVPSDWEDTSNYKVEEETTVERDIASGAKVDQSVTKEHPRAPSSGNKNPALEEEEEAQTPTNKVDFWKWEKKMHGRDH